MVRGLERHLELVDLVKRQEAEYAARAERAFTLRLPEHLPPCTIPQPFFLHGAARQVRGLGRV